MSRSLCWESSALNVAGTALGTRCPITIFSSQSTARRGSPPFWVCVSISCRGRGFHCKVRAGLDTLCDAGAGVCVSFSCAIFTPGWEPPYWQSILRAAQLLQGRSLLHLSFFFRHDSQETGSCRDGLFVASVPSEMLELAPRFMILNFYVLVRNGEGQKQVAKSIKIDDLLDTPGASTELPALNPISPYPYSLYLPGLSGHPRVL